MLLFSPMTLGSLTIKNRIVALPFFTRYADAEGNINQRMLDHYARVASTGVGLVVVESSSIAPRFQGVNSIKAYGKESIAELRKLVGIIHTEGAAAILQICHSGRFSYIKGALAPSPIPPFGNMDHLPKAMDRTDMKDVIDAFVSSAQTVKEAGFDGVELHGGTGYLLSSFISPRTNIREDEYGGSLENRMRFPLEVAQRVRDAVGDFPIGCRFLATERVEGGLQLAESAVFAKRLEDTMAPSYLSVASGTHECLVLPEMQHCDQGYMLGEATGIKKILVSTPVIAAGHLQTVEFCENALQTGATDVIGLGRVLFCDQNWVHKASGADNTPFIPCIQCDNCLKQLQKGKPTFCAKWPKQVREERLTGSRKI